MPVSQTIFKQLALSLPEVVELPHFEVPSFRHKKRIFATLWEDENKALVKLSVVDQSVFCSYDSSVFYPVPNAGARGAKVRKDMLKDALQLAYSGVKSNK